MVRIYKPELLLKKSILDLMPRKRCIVEQYAKASPKALIDFKVLGEKHRRQILNTLQNTGVNAF